MNKERNPLPKYLIPYITHPKIALNLLNKTWIMDIFLDSEKTKVDKDHIVEKDKNYYLKVSSDEYFDKAWNQNCFYGKLVITPLNNKYFYMLTNQAQPIEDANIYYKLELTEIPIPSNPNKALCSFHDTFIATPSMISNLKSSVETTVGRFLVNKVLIEDLFGDIIPYQNEQLDLDTIQEFIARSIMEDEKITIDQVKEFFNRCVFLNGIVHLFVNTITPGLITPSKGLEQLKQKLLNEYKDKPLSVVDMIKIENELIKYDKEQLKDDPSKFFQSGKTFDIHRKRMFMMYGIMEPFGDKEIVNPNFLTSNLDEGWKKEELHHLLNDIRKGSYSRAMETAKGGAESKYLLRTFQDAVIKENDCGTKKGLKVFITEQTKHLYLYKWVILPSGKLELITSKNIDKYVGKEVTIRFPMFCKTEQGFCYKCMGYNYEKLGLKYIADQPLNIGSVFLMISMKSMHGVKIDSVSLEDLDEYLI